MYENTAWYKIAEKYYDRETFEHAKRVAEYATTSPATYEWDYISEDVLYQAALFHDILEDTDFDFNDKKHMHWFYVDTVEAVKLLTKDKSMPYDEYCRQIRYSGNRLAYIIKLADMKDHLSLKETLTPRLKEKYLSGLAELL